MTRRWWLLVVARAVAAVLAAPGLAAAADVRVAVLAWQGEDDAQAHWQPLMTALQRALPAHRLQPVYLDLAGIEQAVAQRRVEFVVTNPGHYVTLEYRHGVTRIATQVIEPGQDTSHTVSSAVVVRDERRDLQRLEDLRGQRLAAVSAEAFGGYQVVWAELVRLGLDPEAGDLQPRFTGFPMQRVLDAVERGEADAGAVRSCLLERLEREGRLAPGRFRVLPRHGAVAPGAAEEPAGPCRTSSAVYPGWAWAAAPQTAPELSREVLVSLLGLPAAQTGQTWGVPADYHAVHDMLRELQVAPYDFLREHRLEAQLRRYWPVAAVLAAVLLLGLAYTLRVEVLVQRRTRELSAALAARDDLAERIQAHRLQMEHLSRLSVLGELSGTLAHEMNQPLATIGNYARSLTRRLASGKLSPDAVAQAATEIASESERAAGILAGIRAFARKRSPVRERRDLAELVDGASRLFRGMVAAAPPVQRLGSLPPGQREVWVDPLQVQQVLLNLLKNALDAQITAGRAGAPIEITLVADPADGDRVAVELRDQGTGLDAAGAARLFEPFFTTKADGMGLGLSICKSIVESHGGSLTARAPDAGHGLVMRFTLPCGPGVDAHPPSSPPAQPSDPTADAPHGPR